MTFVDLYKADVLACFASYKRLAEGALEQVTDDEFFAVSGDVANSIAVIVKHIGGNLRSRWRDFLTTDGEKEDRQRDTEFITDGDTRESLMNLWETGWAIFFESFGALKADDFERTVTIRTEPFSVVSATNRSLAHISYHVGQIVFLAKFLRGTDWKTLSVPRNKSAEFAAFVAARKGTTHYLDAPTQFAAESNDD